MSLIHSGFPNNFGHTVLACFWCIHINPCYMLQRCGIDILYCMFATLCWYNRRTCHHSHLARLDVCNRYMKPCLYIRHSVLLFVLRVRNPICTYYMLQSPQRWLPDFCHSMSCWTPCNYAIYYLAQLRQNSPGVGIPGLLYHRHPQHHHCHRRDLWGRCHCHLGSRQLHHQMN